MTRISFLFIISSQKCSHQLHKLEKQKWNKNLPLFLSYLFGIFGNSFLWNSQKLTIYSFKLFTAYQCDMAHRVWNNMWDCPNHTQNRKYPAKWKMLCRISPLKFFFQACDSFEYIFSFHEILQIIYLFQNFAKSIHQLVMKKIPNIINRLQKKTQILITDCRKKWEFCQTTAEKNNKLHQKFANVNNQSRKKINFVNWSREKNHKFCQMIMQKKLWISAIAIFYKWSQ